MAKTRDRLIDRAEEMRPYVDRALNDQELRDNLKEAFAAAREVYGELLGNRGAVGVAQRVATDKEIQESLRRAVEELRAAADRMQGKAEHNARNRMLLLTGITAGILFNPMTGPATRKWLLDKVTGGGDYDYAAAPPPSTEPTTNGGTAAAATSSTT